MLKKKIFSVVLSAGMMFAGVIPVLAGGALEQIDITGNVPSPIAGHVIGKLVGIKWDARCIPVQYSMNTSLGANIPNPLTPFTPVLTLAAAQAGLQTSFDQWNNLPTSFINMQITGTTNKVTLAGFDMINELTFRTAASFAAIASSPSVSFILDVTLVNGDLLDNDADSDVSSAITVCTDVDNDGDMELPAGFYEAGTIIDNDVQFNTKTTNGLRFTIGDAALDTTTRSVDLNCVATHEFGHSHGLSHTIDNQASDTDGGGTTMFPFIDTGDPADELAQRSLGSDDIAYSSYFYPEGSAASGPAALQPGDVAFSSAYGLITGELKHGVLNQPIAGGSLFAKKWGTNTFVASGFSGTTQVSVSPTGGLFLISPAFNILDGKYVIPVPKGGYAVGAAAVDGQPAAAGNISLTCQIGSAFGQLNFNEEFYNANLELGKEARIGQRKNVPVQAGKVQSGINITTADTINVNNFGARNFIGFTAQAAGSYYAVRVPTSQIQAILTQIDAVNPGKDMLVQAMQFNTSVVDSSVVPVFAEATLTTGTLSGNTATLDLINPLARVNGFIGRDNDFAPFYFEAPQDLGKTIRDGIANGTIQELFMVLRLPTTTPFPGVSNIPPLIGLDGSGSATGLPNDVPIFGFSYLSTNGVTFNKVVNFNFMFSLILSGPVNIPGE
ncbi:MAG: matrixin family metalloprotease [Acidobacteriota bacterium]